MADTDNVSKLPRSIEFTIDGEPFETQERRQPASALLGLAGLDPSRYDLGELVGQRPEPKRYSDQDEVTVRRSSRFVSIRHAADVA